MSDIDANASLLAHNERALPATLTSSAAVVLTVDGDGVATYDGQVSEFVL